MHLLNKSDMHSSDSTCNRSFMVFHNICNICLHSRYCYWSLRAQFTPFHAPFTAACTTSRWCFCRWLCLCVHTMILCDMLRRSIVGRTLVSAGEISLSCDRLLAGWVTTLWLRRPLSVSQHGQLSLPSLRDRLMSSNPCYSGLRRQTAQRRGERCGLPPTLPSAPN